MRTSCNGCRVLRKGCNDDCVIRPSLEWIKSPDSQANATVFLAKFYGRAGLLNLLSPAPAQLRPAIFKSLLYEACGRIVDPVYGSVGLMWSGQWQHCQAAVDAILRGLPIIKVPESFSHQPDPMGTTVAGGSHGIPLAAALKLCDIRHVSSSSSGRSKVKVATTERWEVVEADEDESLFSNETVEASVANPDVNGYPGLELRLGLSQ